MQYTQYLLTGATGFLGRAVAKLLTDRGASVRALVCPNDPLRTYLDTRIEVVYGDVTEDASLDAFFRGRQGGFPLYRCAAMRCAFHYSTRSTSKTGPLLHTRT